MKNKFFTSKGFLTDYALSCGYIEMNQYYPNDNVKITMDSYAKCYYIRVIGVDGCKYKCYFTLSEARKAFVQACKDNNVKRKINY